MANVIYRGPTASEPQTVNLKVAATYKPGVFVTTNGSTLTVATAADQDKELLILSNTRFSGQTVETAYVANDTGVAYRPVPGEAYNVRLKAATYAVGDKLMVDANGYLAAATTGKPVIAHYDGAAGAKTAGELGDVIIANSVAMA